MERALRRDLGRNTPRPVCATTGRMRALSREHYYMHTILTVMIIYAGVLLLALAWLALGIHRSPEGWEDERGFHFGRKGVPTDRRVSAGIHRSSRTDGAHQLIVLVPREDDRT